MTLHRDQPCALTADQLNRTFALAEVVTHLLLTANSGIGPDGARAVWEDFEGDWTSVHQASGMVSVQLGVRVDDALIRLRAHAYATGCRVSDVAKDIVARRLRLGRDTGHEQD